jgi:death-on-curing protein
VEAIHEEEVLRLSSTESIAIRDHGLLESAVMAPQQTFSGKYLYPTISAMAAAYLIGIAQNHPFENGNKRTAFAACYVFLGANGFDLDMTQEEAYNMTIGVVMHTVDRDQLTSLIEKALRAIKD